MLVDSTFKRDLIVTRPQSVLFSAFWNFLGLSPHETFFNLPRLVFLLLLIFYFYCFRSHLYILLFSLCFCHTQGWAVLPHGKQRDCLKALCLHKSAISNQGVCKQKELTISQGAANKDIFGCHRVRTSSQLDLLWAKSPDCSRVAECCFSALCIPSQPGYRTNDECQDERLGTYYVTLCNCLQSVLRTSFHAEYLLLPASVSLHTVPLESSALWPVQ